MRDKSEIEKKTIYKKSKFKKIFYQMIICTLPAIIYMIIFIVNANTLAVRHMEEELFYPIIMCILSAFLFPLWLILYRKNKLFKISCPLIPLIYIIIGMTTLYIGYKTPCCTGG